MSEKLPPGYLILRVREAGYRVTAARMAVCQVLEESETHVNAEELCAEAQKILPAINLASVYRTLTILDELGLVHEVRIGTLPGRWAVASGDAELHLHCTECEAVYHHPLKDTLEPLLDHIKADHGFEVQRANLVLNGVCGNCMHNHLK
ncbi:Fur family transcriptional regulator [Stomatohabitans albus]|uniref:Fur family transcriptional regulator n=1 Tax=Stomatohabitans albus TaxID=3110766 RepID=UPI00300D18E9